MPGFALGKLAGRQLAMYLVYHDRATTGPFELPPMPARDAVLATFRALESSERERARFESLTDDEQVQELGRYVVRVKNCAACHELKPAGEKEPWKPEASRFNFAAIAARPSGGCLAANDDLPLPQSAPRFGPALDRDAAAAFLRAAAHAPASPAPGDAARLALQRFNCLGCHERDGRGGLTPEFINRLGKGNDAAAELVTPPTLTQVTAKLTPAALRGVLERDERARAWMSLQMPRFPREHMSELPKQLAAFDAQPWTDAPNDVPAKPVAARPDDDDGNDMALAEAGRTLVGSRGFGCTKCHDMLAIPSSGTRGPDLANVTARVTRAWYVRWMKDPQRIQQGTRMPTVFLEGQSPYKDVLDGDPARQREAIWEYLAAARSLPPPEGLEEKKLEMLAAGTKPLAVRTFLPGTTPRGIAIRFPNNVHAAFDAQTCRLAYVWSGEFLDMGPVWNGRGGHEAHVLGSSFWTAPAGCPWETGAADAAAPSFASRGDDPTFGALVRDGRFHPSRLSLLGYSVDDSAATFRYRMALDDGRSATFSERIASLRGDAGVGVLRELEIAAPADKTLWLHVTESDAEPIWNAGDTNGALAAGESRAAGDGTLRIVHGGYPLLLHVRSSSNPTAWVVAREQDRWQVLLRIPCPADGAVRSAALALWRASGDTPEAWQHLVAEELK